MASGRINRNAIPEMDSGMGLGGYTLKEGAHIAWSESGEFDRRSDRVSPNYQG